MAKLHQKIESDDELPALDKILGRAEIGDKHRNPTRVRQSEPKPTHFQYDGDVAGKTRSSRSPKKSVTLSPEKVVTATSNDKQARKQTPLRLAHVNSLLLPPVNEYLRLPKKVDLDLEERPERSQIRSSPRKAAKQKYNYAAFVSDLEDALPSTDEDDSSDDLSDFIVADSASEDELRRPRSIRNDVQRTPRRLFRKKDLDFKLKNEEEPEELKRPGSIIDLTSPIKNISTAGQDHDREFSPQKRHSGGDPLANNPFADIKFSPPRHNHQETDKDVRFVTPPSSPSKSKLRSPTKAARIRVPPSPHRPSIDAFWSQEVINDWNDQYSPRKTPTSRRLFRLDENDEADLSPSSSPRKSPIKSPAKMDKAAIERRKKFDAKKHELASSFLKELDETVASGQVGALAASTGGIHIVWSKKLNSTAGRANWKREAIKVKNEEGVTVSTTYKHHASIELAEKVIDDEDRLNNVLAHEYCHLANFMISNVKTNPHGQEFKKWARKTTHLFAHLNIHVTTKHTYAIAYKYIWACTLCGLEFKRHSRSIDPRRHACGSCKGPLVQVQPAPRREKKGEGEAAGGGYAAFVKGNFQAVRGECEGGNGDVMRELGRRYREGKRKGVVGDKGDVEVEVVEIGSGDEGNGVEEEGVDMDAVARELDFLTL